jgi:hypothetical protein
VEIKIDLLAKERSRPCKVVKAKLVSIERQ